MGIQVSPVAVHTVVSGDLRSRLMCRGHIVTALERVAVEAGDSRVIKPLGNVPAGEMISRRPQKDVVEAGLGAYRRLSLGRRRCGPVDSAIISRRRSRGSRGIKEQEDHESGERA